MAGLLDIVFEQGASFSRQLAWRDLNGVLIDTTGYTARMHVREILASPTTIIELTNANGRIAVGIVGTGADASNVRLSIAPADTALLPSDGQGVYDLELVAVGGAVTRVLQGTIFFSGEVTR